MSLIRGVDKEQSLEVIHEEVAIVLVYGFMMQTHTHKQSPGTPFLYKGSWVMAVEDTKEQCFPCVKMHSGNDRGPYIPAYTGVTGELCQLWTLRSLAVDTHQLDSAPLSDPVSNLPPQRTPFLFYSSSFS